MKRALMAVTLSAVAFAGCERKDQSSTTPSTDPPSASGNPGGYLGAVAKAKKSSEKTIDAVSLNKTIQLFNVSEGRFPKDLNELVTEKYLGSIPVAPYGMKIVYDAAKGEVKVVPK